MDMETLFMSCFSVQKKPADIFALIEAAILVGTCKYPGEFEKRKSRILDMIMRPGISNHDVDSILDDEEQVSDDSVADEVISNVGDQEKDEVIKVEEKEEPEKEKQQIYTQSKNKITATNQKPTMKIKLAIKRTVQVAPLKKLDQPQKQNISNEITGTTRKFRELKKRSATEQLDGNEEGTLQSDDTTTGSRKRMSLMKMNVSTKRVEVAPREKQFHSDCSPQFKKLEEGEQTTNEKESHKDFKKMESDTEKKREEGARQTLTQRRNYNMGSATKQCSSGLTKSMPPLKKMNVAAKRVGITHTHHKKQLLSDCSSQLEGGAQLQKQSNCSAITRPMQKTTQSSADARPMQEATQGIKDMKKFESSKRKFEERFAEQKKAKRRSIMVDFHDMPKPANDPLAPRRCWGRRKF